MVGELDPVVHDTRPILGVLVGRLALQLLNIYAHLSLLGVLAIDDDMHVKKGGAKLRLAALEKFINYAGRQQLHGLSS